MFNKHSRADLTIRHIIVYSRLSVIAISVVVIFGCSPDPTSSIVLTPIEPEVSINTSAASTPVSVETTATAEQVSREAKVIASGDISRVQWSEDSMAIYYSSIGLSETEVRLYNIADETTTNTTFPVTLPVTEAYIFERSLSPSGNIQVLRRESLKQDGTTDVYISFNGTEQVVYNLQECVALYYWTTDERFVLVRPILEPGCEVVPFSIDTKSFEVRELLTFAQYQLTKWESFSPDEAAFIYQLDDIYHIYYLYEDSPIALSTIPSQLQWVIPSSDRYVLIGYNMDETGKRWAIARSAIAGNSTEIVLDSDIVLASNPKLREGGTLSTSAEMSPNSRWLALTVRLTDEGKQQLWLLPLDF